ncbi:MAG: hypothetical protein K0S12_501 [Bacteroidetes bacterium]|nr:hypothetical protein [Bacteroidota bacterium]
MKVCVSIFLVFTVAFWSCDGSDENNTSDKRDTIPPLMTLRGNPLDTSYLYSRYDDPKVNVLDFIKGRLRCPDDGILIKTHGFVDNERLGVYTLTYTAEDAAGNQAPPLTRTVVVRPNPDGFLTGNYNVVCTCTASLKGSAPSRLSTQHYEGNIRSL